MPEILTAEQVGERLNLNKQTVHQLAREGKIPYLSTGPRGQGRRFIMEDVLAALYVPAKGGRNGRNRIRRVAS